MLRQQRRSGAKRSEETRLGRPLRSSARGGVPFGASSRDGSRSDGHDFLSHLVASVERMQLTATVRTIPDPAANDIDSLRMDVITSEAADYDTAYARLSTRIPDGWQLLSVRRH